MINRWLFIFLVLCGSIASCRKDRPEDAAKPDINIGADGVYITNEGAFTFGNATVSYFDPGNQSVVEDLFEPANNRPLGDVCQSMSVFNGKAYVVINNSGKIEVVDPGTFVSSAIISGFTSPRYLLPVSNSKAYVTDYASNTISVVNLGTNTISGSIPCSGWTEQLVLSYGKAFVTNQRRDKVYVINTLNDQLTDSILVGYGSNSIIEDCNGKLWVLCGGDEPNNIPGSLSRINPVNHAVEQTFLFPVSTSAPWRLTANGTNDTLYFLNNGVYRMPVNATALPGSAFITQGSRNFYGVGVDPVQRVVYVADAIDFVQRGVVYRYTTNGTLIDSFLAGIGPGDFYFR